MVVEGSIRGGEVESWAEARVDCYQAYQSRQTTTMKWCAVREVVNLYVVIRMRLKKRKLHILVRSKQLIFKTS